VITYLSSNKHDGEGDVCKAKFLCGEDRCLKLDAVRVRNNSIVAMCGHGVWLTWMDGQSGARVQARLGRRTGG